MTLYLDSKINFLNYKFESIRLKCELSLILTSMTREIKSAFNTKLLVNEQYDACNVTSEHLQMERNTKKIFSK